MEVIYLNLDQALNQPIAVALGYFDGLHLGHQAVIKEAVEYAKNHQIRSAVMTFSPSPSVFLKKSEHVSLLTPNGEKVRLLKSLGVDELWILPFDEELANTRAKDFIERYLIQQRVVHVSTGFDFRFGRRGEGEVELLKTYQNQFNLSITSKYELEDEKIGSTEIKSYLAEGQIKKVTQMLGRPYCIRGKVVTGKQKGRQIGFPTANLQLTEDYVIPKSGVYAVEVVVEGRCYAGMCNIGHNPTFNFNNQLSIETYILDFNADIYGEELTLKFCEYLRQEQQFNSIDVLITQLEADHQFVRSYFNLNLN
ncbi:MAG: bifunctional riboflavin kinase/FAD synthetase [Turicibacter sp.]|nr:bifunctional riboflavin kinase/FAD synthetase [Turicibacter sp.]